MFKVSVVDQWLVVVTGTQIVEDIRKRPDDEVSSMEGVETNLNTRYTVGGSWIDDPYHIPIIRDKLIRSLAVVLPDVLDELALAVPTHIPAKGDGECLACATFLWKLTPKIRVAPCVGVPRNAENRC